MKKNNPSALQAMQWVVCVLMFLVMLAAIAGIYETHFVGAGATFGTTGASLALIAFAISATAWLKTLSYCLGGCEK